MMSEEKYYRVHKSEMDKIVQYTAKANFEAFNNKRFFFLAIAFLMVIAVLFSVSFDFMTTGSIPKNLGLISGIVTFNVILCIVFWVILGKKYSYEYFYKSQHKFFDDLMYEAEARSEIDYLTQTDGGTP